MKRFFKIAASWTIAAWLLPAAYADQAKLEIVTNAHDTVLQLDWPGLHIGTGEYEEGPTGVTVFHFQKKVLAAMHVLGGSPSSVNQAYMDLGYDYPELDTVVFAGGSWYGLETVTAVSSALKDDGLRNGQAFGDEPNIALSVGSIIFDFGGRRLNEIYPDKRLAQAAFRAAKPGFFPQGAHGAGRMAKSGGFFGCNSFSGQGGAQRSVGELKVAAFAVVNPYGVVTDRNGQVVACFPKAGWPRDLSSHELMADFPDSMDSEWTPEGNRTNTTVSLLVVNQILSPVELKRLAVQVHASMSRAIQPFATLYDGDVLYAVSTAEIDQSKLSSPEIGVLASEVMWDAILASVPEQPEIPAANKTSQATIADLDAFCGEYLFSNTAWLSITRNNRKLLAQATGLVNIFSISKDIEVELQALSANEFLIPGRYPLVLQFEKPGTLVLNPGHWQQTGNRIELN